MVFTHLAISGGGTKGIACVGSLLYLEKHNVLKDVRFFLGTSIGSVICSLLTVFDVNRILNSIHILTCLSFDNVDLKTLFTHYGILSKKSLIENIDTLFRTVFSDSPTFGDLYSYSNKELTITALNLNTRCIEFFNHTSAPNMKVVDAISMSINIPLLFEMERYNDNVYVDAGLINNMSWDYFSSISDKNKLGIYMVHDSAEHTEIKNLSGYLMNIIECVFLHTFRKYEESLPPGSVIFLKDTTSVFDLSPTKNTIRRLLNIGHDEAQLYLKKTI